MTDVSNTKFSIPEKMKENFKKDSVCKLYSSDQYCFQMDCPYKHQLLKSNYHIEVRFETLGSDSKDYAEVEKRWRSHYKGNPRNIKKVEKVINPRLENLFEKRRTEKKSPVKFYGFHGTPEDNIKVIATEGFKKEYQIKNVYGVGTYFAHDPEVAVAYCRSKGQKVFLCEVHIESDNSDALFEKQNMYYIIPEPKGIMPRFVITFE